MDIHSLKLGIANANRVAALKSEVFLKKKWEERLGHMSQVDLHAEIATVVSKVRSMYEKAHLGKSLLKICS